MLRMILHSLVLLSLMTACQKDKETDSKPNPTPTEQLTMVDANATAQTKALYSRLWSIRNTGFMFGHHDDLLYGHTWMKEQDRSDVKDVCGDYPGIFSVDFAEIMDDRYQWSTLNADRRRVILEARRRGEVITACCHLNNPLTGGDSWDNSNNTVAAQILTEGSATNLKFKTWLDRLADFMLNLKDDNGQLIPVLFRPFHEHTQAWSWWGKSCTTQSEFIGLWQFTISYLRDTKGVHNLIYAISPQMDGMQTKDDILFRWPGDEWVDFMGMDCYHGTYTDAFTNNLVNLTQLSKAKMKPCGVTETGIEGIKKSDGSPYTDYWSKEILTPCTGRKISLVVVWRNAYQNETHFYGPFAGCASAADFVKFYNSPITLFSNDLPDMYTLADGVVVK